MKSILWFLCLLVTFQGLCTQCWTLILVHKDTILMIMLPMLLQADTCICYFHIVNAPIPPNAVTNPILLHYKHMLLPITVYCCLFYSVFFMPSLRYATVSDTSNGSTLPWSFSFLLFLLVTDSSVAFLLVRMRAPSVAATKL